MNSVPGHPPPNEPFLATLAGVAGEQAGDFEAALRRAAGPLRVRVTCVEGVKEASFPAAAVHAVVLGRAEAGRADVADAAVLRQATAPGTCRVYVLDEAGASPGAGGGVLDDFIQRTGSGGNAGVAGEIAVFFREADLLNRRGALLALRDAACIGAYGILNLLWPVSYAFAAAHALNAAASLAGRALFSGWLGGGFMIAAATFFGCFFAAHCVISITRNWLFMTRVAGGRISELSIRTSALGAAAAVTLYSVAVTDPDGWRVLFLAALAVALHWVHAYARRIRAECVSLSGLQAALADPQSREVVLDSIGSLRFVHSAFPLFPFRSRSVFISYMHGSRWSSESAALVQEWASKRGREVFLDRSSIPSGALWRQSLLRAAGECGLFVAVVDGDAEITEWVLAESAYAALLRKNTGKPVILLVARNARRIAGDEWNPVQRIYRDVFALPPELRFGAAILAVDEDEPLTEERFLAALEGVRPMRLTG